MELVGQFAKTVPVVVCTSLRLSFLRREAMSSRDASLLNRSMSIGVVRFMSDLSGEGGVERDRADRRADAEPPADAETAAMRSLSAAVLYRLTTPESDPTA